MEQFSLEEYLKNPSRALVTRDGYPARIICTDALNSHESPIIAQVWGEDGYEDTIITIGRADCIITSPLN